jgi:hypothetical protein
VGWGQLKGDESPTCRHLEIRDGLPLIHGYEPRVVPFSTAQVDDELLLVSAQSLQCALQPLLRQRSFREEEGSDDDLMRILF